MSCLCQCLCWQTARDDEGGRGADEEDRNNLPRGGLTLSSTGMMMTNRIQDYTRKREGEMVLNSQNTGQGFSFLFEVFREGLNGKKRFLSGIARIT